MASCTFGTILKRCTVANTAYPLSATSLKVSSVTLQVIGGNSSAVGANVGKIYFGTSTVVGSTTGPQLAIPQTGATVPAVRFDSGNSDNLIDLTDIYIAADTADDGVIALYQVRG